MPTRLKHLLTLLLFLLAIPAQADTLLLVHGYFSGVSAWTENGITKTLENAGWHDGGQITATARGLHPVYTPNTTNPQRFYLADLPSEAPLMVQADMLSQIALTLKKRHPNEKTILVGHSAGGVVARLAMVKNKALDIYGLITIAAPHLGTDTAEAANLIANSPMGMVAPFLGAGTLNRSRQLYADLVRERPGTLLFQLNRKPHPKAHYVAIIRQEAFALWGDNTVPAWSQDMRNVPALKGKTQAMTGGDEHGLEREDGQRILAILQQWLRDGGGMGFKNPRLSGS